MNKYKIISLLLSIALITSLVRLVVARHQEPAPTDSAVSAKDIVLQNIHARKSVRSYTDRAVTPEQIDTLLRAAMAAPSGRDMRPWHFVVIDESATMHKLSEALPYAQMLKEAPVAIVVCGDTGLLDAQGNPGRNWPFDCSAATQNLLLAVEAMGLGAVWTGVYPYEDRTAAVKEALALPDHIVPLNVVPVGYPKGETKPKEKYDPTHIHKNGW